MLILRCSRRPRHHQRLLGACRLSASPTESRQSRGCNSKAFPKRDPSVPAREGARSSPGRRTIRLCLPLSLLHPPARTLTGTDTRVVVVAAAVAAAPEIAHSPTENMPESTHDCSGDNWDVVADGTAVGEGILRSSCRHWAGRRHGPLLRREPSRLESETSWFGERWMLLLVWYHVIPLYYYLCLCVMYGTTVEWSVQK